MIHQVISLPILFIYSPNFHTFDHQIMSSTQLQCNDHNTKRESNPLSPSSSSLKINKDSHLIKKSSPSSSSSSSSSLLNGVASVTTKPQPRHPVIIYTHSPKIIHTHPKDFMALVQKLTGLSRSEDDQNTPLPQQQPKSEPTSYEFNDENNKNGNRGVISDDNESTSVVTDENNSSLGDPQINSCYVPSPVFDPPNPCFSNALPFLNPNSTDFLCSAQPFYNYSESLFYMPNMRSSFSSSSLEGMKELPEF